jgi:putative DNA methylase
MAAHALRNLAKYPNLSDRPIAEWDVAGLLKAIWEAWNSIFKKTLGHAERALESGGESAEASLVVRKGSKAEPAREPAYRLYVICECKKRAQEALSYNALVQSWPEIERLAREEGKGTVEQGSLFG